MRAFAIVETTEKTERTSFVFPLENQVFHDTVPALGAVRRDRRIRLPRHADQREVQRQSAPRGLEKNTFSRLF